MAKDGQINPRFELDKSAPPDVERQTPKYDEDKDPDNHNLDDELKKCLKFITDKVEKEDSWVRKQQIKLWKKNEEFWHGVQFIFWSESKQDWISPSETRWFEQEEGREEAEGPFYDFVINIYKAHGESIIAALSSQVPAVRFPPDDANNPDDIATSRTFSKISDLILRHNKSKIMMLRALLTLWNQGNVFAYIAPKTDKAFGLNQTPIWKEGLACPQCGTVVPNPKKEDEESEAGNEQTAGLTCQTCAGVPLQPTAILDGYDKAPKSRVLIDLYTPLFVKVPYYAIEQKDFGYLRLGVDKPIAYLKAMYPWIRDDIERDYKEGAQFEKLARTPSSYNSYSRIDETLDLTTLYRYWLRPWQFEMLPDEDEESREKLKEMFPDGCYCAYIGDTYAESRNEDMDKYWTVGKAGLSQFIHSDPLGQSLIPIQEITNVLTNLTLETIEQGIPSMFADSDTLNFEVYSRHEARPGMVYPVKGKPGKSIGDSFFTQDRATLSKEVPMFAKQLEQMGQFVTGAFPSIYGGIQDAKTRTAAEYNMSRQMALQRLSICWTFLTEWVSRLLERAVHLYVENMVTDDKYTVPDPTTESNYATILIKRAELTGKVGDVESEGSESFPMSAPQKQQLLTHLMEMNNPFLNTALFDPNNRTVMADMLSMPEFEIPGEDQRLKQTREIHQMLQSHQLVQPEPLIDDNDIHISVTRHFLVSLEGYDLQKTDPQAYQIISQHLQLHTQLQAQLTMAQAGNSPPGQDPDQPEPEA